MADDRMPDHPDATAYSPRQAREAWLVRRRRKIREEIERNRRGEYKVPTWVLALILVVFVVAWVSLIIFS